MNGIINFLKPTGMTSSDAVMVVKGLAKTKKVGHLGTLDPEASGVLPIAINRCTKLFDLYLKKDKLYRAFFDFSLTTDTLDSDGKVVERATKVVSVDSLKSVLKTQIGKLEQIPPQFSAKVVNGKRAYDLARRGQFVELKPSNVEVYNIEFVRTYKENGFVLDIACSSGTYIRSIVRDLATELDTVGFMPALIRLQSGNFKIEDAVSVEELRENFSKFLIKPEQALDFLPKIDIEDIDIYSKILNGVKVEFETDGLFRCFYKENFVGVLEVSQNIGKLKINLGF